MKEVLLYKEWLTVWKKQKQGYVRESTLANYSTAITSHILPVLGERRITDITERCLQETALFWLHHGRCDGMGGLSERTVRNLVTIVKITLKAAAKEGHLPMYRYEIRYPRSEQRKELCVLESGQQEILTEYLRTHPTYKNVGILLCLHTGVRIGELCGLRWEDLNMTERTMQIRRTVQRISRHDKNGIGYTELLISEPKTACSNRTIPLSSVICPILAAIRPDDPSIYLLTGTKEPTEPRIYREYYQRLLERLGIAPIRFHGLRHTFATRLIENGADYKTVSELLGHASVNTTLNLYVHPHMEQKRKAVELLCTP